MKGLENKYIITRKDGSEVDPSNFYFCLKLEGEGDPKHIAASRKAIITYAEEIKEYLPELSKDLLKRYKCE